MASPNAADQRLKRQVQQRCEDDRAWLLTSQPFTAKLLMQLRLVAVVDDRLPTAGTDGESIFFNAGFMASRSDADRRFILAHEVWHCALGHHRRELGRELTRWNHACDYEVNALLKQALGHCPQDALYRKAFVGQSAEQIYARLPAGTAPPGQTLDVHQPAAVPGTPGQVHDPDFTPQQASEHSARQWRQRLVATAQQVEREYGRGSLPGSVQRLIDRLRRPTVPWQQVLAQFIHTTLSGSRQWTPPSRRHVHQGLYLPSQRSQTLSLAVAIDTSGSCQDVLPDFLSELAGILGACDRVSLDALAFDARITQRQTFNEGELYRLTQSEWRGGGGSDIRPVFTALEQGAPPDVLVALTDGHIAAPAKAPDYPVLWCLPQGGRKPTEWGVELRMVP